MYRFCCITFIEYMIAGKALFDYTNLYSPYDYKKNEKMIQSTLKKNMTKEHVSRDFRLKNR